MRDNDWVSKDLMSTKQGKIVGLSAVSILALLSLWINHAAEVADKQAREPAEAKARLKKALKSPTPSEDPVARQASLEKSKEWYAKGVYGLAEVEARKAGTDVAAQEMLLASLLAQPEGPDKQVEAESVARSLASEAPPDSSAAKAAEQFLAGRKSEEEVEALRLALSAEGADKTKLLADFPEQNRGLAYYGLAFETTSAQPGGGADEASKTSTSYQNAKAYLALKPEGALAIKAAKFVETVDGSEGMAKSPLEAFHAAYAAPEGEVAILKQTKFVSAKQKIKGDSGVVQAVLQFTNPYTKKSQKAEVEIACRQRRGVWQVSWSGSKLTALGPLLGDPSKTLRRDGIAGLFRHGDSIEQLKAALELKPAQAGWEEATYKPESALHLYRSDKYQIAVVRKKLGKPDIVVRNPAYRLSNGLGVGDSFSDFLNLYDYATPERPAAQMGHLGYFDLGFITETGENVFAAPIYLVAKSGVHEENVIAFAVCRDLSADETGQEITAKKVWGLLYR